MKRNTPDHPKVLALASALRAYLKEQGLDLPFRFCQTFAVGLLEQLWHFTAKYCHAGDVGKYPDDALAMKVGWTFDPNWLVKTLVETRLLDELPESRLYVHDWHVHSEDAVDKYLRDKNLRYANGARTRRKKQDGASRDKSRSSRVSHSHSHSHSHSQEPLPKPEPEPGPAPKPEPSASRLPPLPPTIDQPPMRAVLEAWLTYKAERREPYKPQGLKAFVSRVETLARKHGVAPIVDAMQRAMASGWQGWEHDLGTSGSNGRGRHEDPRGNLAARERYLISEGIDPQTGEVLDG